MKPNDKTNHADEHDMVKNLNWQEVDQLAIYKHDQGVEPGSTERQLQLSGKSGPLDFKSSALSTQPCCLHFSVLSQIVRK